MAFFAKIPRIYLASVDERNYHSELIRQITDLLREVERLKARVKALEDAGNTGG